MIHYSQRSRMSIESLAATSGLMHREAQDAILSLCHICAATQDADDNQMLFGHGPSVSVVYQVRSGSGMHVEDVIVREKA